MQQPEKGSDHELEAQARGAEMTLLERAVELGEQIKRRFGHVRHDASTLPAEAYYGSIYLELVGRHLGSPPQRILDAGCGTGRILVPLAKRGDQLTGIDYHLDSLRRARSNAEAAGVAAEFVHGDVEERLAAYPDHAFDAALALESLYTSRQFAATFRELGRLVRPGGHLMVAHRTRHFYLLQRLAMGDLDGALLVATSCEGRLLKGHHRIFYNWQSDAELDRLYAEGGMAILAKHPIGPYSGFSADPLQSICDPGDLSEGQRQLLRRIEMEHCDPETRMACRYLLVIAQKEGVG